MHTGLAIFGVLVFPAIAELNSVNLKKSDVENPTPKVALSDEKVDIKHKSASHIKFMIGLGNFSRSQVSNMGKMKRRKERILIRTNKSWQNNKYQNSNYDFARYDEIRNNEKANLVRNKTIEILKSGLKILKAGESYIINENNSTSRLNETFLEKILSSAVSKEDVLLSGSGINQLPMGFGLYKTKSPFFDNHTLSSFSEVNFKGYQSKHQNEKHNKNISNGYNYELMPNFHFGISNDTTKLNETSIEDKSLGTQLQQIMHAFKNLTDGSNEYCINRKKTHSEDPCQKWLNCRKSLEKAFTEDTNSLPSCPCFYPSSIFYDDMIWDKNKKKYFRWRDASSEAERLDIYKPGAAFCIRSLLTRGSLSVSSQQCCYDRSLQLLTRGSGAGTVNFVSPEISKKLHYTVDILPWRLCKGDFTRYNSGRYPDNGNDCPENPHENLYRLQVKLSRVF